MSIKHSNASAWEKNTRTTTKAILLGFTCLQWPDCGPKIGSKFYCRFVPRAGSCTAANSVLLNHLVCTTEQRKRKRDAERPSSLEIDDQLDLGDLLDRQVGRLLSLEHFWGFLSLFVY